MNPEFQRNLWLEATPRRLSLIAGLLLLAFFAAYSSPFDSVKPLSAARLFYWFLVIGWGTRNAALAVVGEIRDRTWDAQRLSSLDPFAMSWGKLFGSTAANWFGGVICLLVIDVYDVVTHGPAYAAREIAFLIAMGILAQGASLLASLMLVRRRQAQSRLDTFLCQTAGILAAIPFYSGALPQAAPGNTLTWWNRAIEFQDFQLMTMLLFTFWVLVGCYRLMRQELRVTNGPWVWLMFMAFIALYAAGIDPWRLDPGRTHIYPQNYELCIRLGLADLALIAFAYVMAILEPKDPVRLRWLAEQVRRLRFGRVFQVLDCWMMSYIAVVAVTLALAWVTAGPVLPSNLPVGAKGDVLISVLTGLGFFTRDIAICVLMGVSTRQKRGEFAVVAVLAALYLLGPAIFGSIYRDALILFYPRLMHPLPAAILIPWAEAVAVIVWTILRLRRVRAAG